MIRFKIWKDNINEIESIFDFMVFRDNFMTKDQVVTRMKLMESEEEHKMGLGTFNPIASALVNQTFPSTFANKVVGLQPMSTPVGLAYALRIMYGDEDDA